MSSFSINACRCPSSPLPPLPLIYQLLSTAVFVCLPFVLLALSIQLLRDICHAIFWSCGKNRLSQLWQQLHLIENRYEFRAHIDFYCISFRFFFGFHFSTFYISCIFKTNRINYSHFHFVVLVTMKLCVFVPEYGINLIKMQWTQELEHQSIEIAF